MRAEYDCVIIGAGVTGLTIAYHLCRRGMNDILVIDRSYIGSGASGRNGGGVRAQWSKRENIILAKESIEAFRRLSRELGYNIWFRQGGYLFLAENEEQVEALKRGIALQNRHGVPTRFIDQEHLNDIVPSLDSSRFLGGAFNPRDGTILPFPLLWGYRDRIVGMGGEILTHTEVTAVETERREVTGLRTSSGRVATPRVVNAAGKWSSQVGSMAGIGIPTSPYRHEIMVTEALRPFLDPMIVTVTDRLYMSQSMRGELIGGISEPGAEPSDSWESSYQFARRMSRRILELFPGLGGVNMLRQWAGSYDVSPDNSPILGEAEDLKGFYMACGFSGHGLMISPKVGTMMAELILTGRADPLLAGNDLARFERPHGASRHESLVIG